MHDSLSHIVQNAGITQPTRSNSNCNKPELDSLRAPGYQGGSQILGRGSCANAAIPRWNGMRLGRALLLPVLGLSLLTGCVERKFLVVSEPSGATVFVNHVPLNTYTPADGSFLYTGDYDVTIVKDGSETLEVRQPVPARWFDYPVLDFVAENLIPWTIHDNRVWGPYKLQPLPIVSPDEVRGRAEVLRQQAQGLHAPGTPAPPVGPTILPPPTPLLPPAPGVAPPPSGDATPPQGAILSPPQ
jgi:hypothetical protein